MDPEAVATSAGIALVFVPLSACAWLFREGLYFLLQRYWLRLGFRARMVVDDLGSTWRCWTIRYDAWRAEHDPEQQLRKWLRAAPASVDGGRGITEEEIDELVAQLRGDEVAMCDRTIRLLAAFSPDPGETSSRRPPPAVRVSCERALRALTKAERRAFCAPREVRRLNLVPGDAPVIALLAGFGSKAFAALSLSSADAAERVLPWAAPGVDSNQKARLGFGTSR